MQTSTPVVAKDQPATLHGWAAEDPEVLAGCFFADAIEGWRKSIRATASGHGVASDLAFARDPYEIEQDSPTTLAVLTCGDVQVPLRVKQHLRFRGETNSKRMGDRLMKRVDKLQREHVALAERLARLRRVIEEAVEEIGHGATVSRFVIHPQEFDERPPGYKKCLVEIEVELLGDDLRPRAEQFLSINVEDFIEALRLYKLLQIKRAEAKAARTVNPGKIEAEAMALYLLERSGVRLRDVAELDGIHAINSLFDLNVKGAKLTGVQFSLVNGRIATRFAFDGGFYNRGSVYLNDTLPPSIADSCVGRNINEIIEGGIFEVVNPKVVGLGEMTAATCFRLEVLTRWVEVKGWSPRPALE